MAKGQDGFSPVGPAMAAADVDPATLHLTGLVNGEVRQDTTGGDLIFSFAQLIADLSRFMTLEPGDVILTGTPAGAGVVVPGDVVEVRLEGAGRGGTRPLRRDAQGHGRRPGVRHRRQSGPAQPARPAAARGSQRRRAWPRSARYRRPP